MTKLNPNVLGEEPEATAETAASKGKKGGKANGKAKGKGKKGAAAAGCATKGAAAAVVLTAEDKPLMGGSSSAAKAKSSEGMDGMRTSTNAYMLIYSRRGSAAEADGTVASDDATVPDDQIVNLERVRKENDQAREGLKAYKDETAAEEARIDTAKKNIEVTLDLLETTPAEGEPYRWISTEYLKQYVTGRKDLPDLKTCNSKVLCDVHDKVCVAPQAKRITIAAWESIVASEKRDVNMLTGNDVCTECALSLTTTRVTELTRILRDNQSLENFSTIDDASGQSNDSVYMSKLWIKRWKSRAGKKSNGSLQRAPQVQSNPHPT